MEQLTYSQLSGDQKIAQAVHEVLDHGWKPTIFEQPTEVLVAPEKQGSSWSTVTQRVLSLGFSMLVAAGIVTNVDAADCNKNPELCTNAPPLPCPQELRSAPFHGGAAAFAFIFENTPGMPDYMSVTPGARLLAPVTDRKFILDVTTDPSWRNTEFSTRLVVTSEGKGWAVDSGTRNALHVDSKGRAYSEFVRPNGAGMDITEESDGSLVGHALWRLTKLQNDGSVKMVVNREGQWVPERVTAESKMCPVCVSLEDPSKGKNFIAELGISTRKDQYHANDIDYSHPQTLVAPEPEHLYEQDFK